MTDSSGDKEMAGHGSITDVLLERQRLAIFEHAGAGAFRPIGAIPDWLQSLGGLEVDADGHVRPGERFPVLDNFLIDAEDVWTAHSREDASSGTWIEEGDDGEEIALEATALCVESRPILFVENPQRFYLDQHQWLQTAREARLKHERLAREIQKKEILLHCIVHDLSQPLTSMRGCFRCLEFVEMSADAKDLLVLGLEQSARQEQMIRDILKTFSNELSAQQTFHRSAEQAPDLLQSARDTVRDFGAAFREQNAHIALDLGVDEQRSWKVVGDASRLNRVWANLVENALRYSPPQSTVTLGLADEGSQILAYVDDQGPGLPEGATAAKLFGLFAKGKERSGKAGLGLYFCRITVERWGGSIGCESRPAGGTRFWFRLPRAESVELAAKGPPQAAVTAPLAAPVPTPAPSAGQATVQPSEEVISAKAAPLSNQWRPLNVLVADDVEANQMVVSVMLEKRGHRCAAVADGRKLLHHLVEHPVDVVLMDDHMPEMDGVHATLAIREKEKASGRHLTIIAVSGSWQEPDRNRFLGAGADTFLSKPFEPEELYATLEKFFFAPGVTPPATADTGGLDASQVMKRFGQNERFVRSLVTSFLQDSQRRLDDIGRALMKKDGKLLASTTHALAGSADMLGATHLARLARLCTSSAEGAIEEAQSAYQNLQSEFTLLRERLSSLARGGTGKASKIKARKQAGRKAGSR